MGWWRGGCCGMSRCRVPCHDGSRGDGSLVKNAREPYYSPMSSIVEHGVRKLPMAPYEAHRFCRVLADRVTASVVAIFAGVPRVDAIRNACFKHEFTLMPHLNLGIGLGDRKPAAIISERAGTASRILDLHNTNRFDFRRVFNNIQPKCLSLLQCEIKLGT